MTDSAKPGRVAGKTALITGAAQGLGAAIAHRLAAEGAKVFLTDILGEEAARTAAALNATFGTGTAWSATHDVRDEDQWQAVTEQAAGAMGGLSVLVHNAGVGSMGAIEELDRREWRRVMDINVDSVFLGTKHALRYMRTSGPGSIVTISSIAGLLGVAEYPAYNASKAAVWMLTKSIALYCAQHKINVRCNSVHPAYIRTAIVEPLFKALGEEEATRRLTRSIPLGRMGDHDDVAYAVLYLASDESKFVTGAEFKIDGGASAC